MSPTVSSRPAPCIEPEPRALNFEEARKLAIFRDISQMLAEQPELEVALKGVLQILVTRSPTGIAGGMVLVFDEPNHRIEIHVTEGPSTWRPQRAKPVSSDVTGQVVRKRRPLVAPR